jgi:hypothetical protein
MKQTLSIHFEAPSSGWGFFICRGFYWEILRYAEPEMGNVRSAWLDVLMKH